MKTARFVLTTLLAAAATVMVACGESTPLGPKPALAPTVDLATAAYRSRQHRDLLPCLPGPADYAEKVIGPMGGVLQVGAHTLAVPPGALSRPVTIRAVAESDGLNHVEFEPEGLVFNTPATLTMSYANCSAPPAAVTTRIAYTDSALTVIYHLPSNDNPWSKQVSGQLNHFSEYAVAW
jgi:hypothetical protein